MANENILKQTKELKDSMAKERDSLSSKLDDEVIAKENLLKKIRELEDSQENHLKKIRQLDDSRAKERDSLKSKLSTAEENLQLHYRLKGSGRKQSWIFSGGYYYLDTGILLIYRNNFSTPYFLGLK